MNLLAGKDYFCPLAFFKKLTNTNIIFMQTLRKSGLFSLLLVVLALLFSSPLHAAWLKDQQVTVAQPDGTKLHLLATGDEFYNWLHDAAGYTIIQSETDGYFYYAILSNDRLVPSSHRVGLVDPSTTNLYPGINISAEQRLAIRTYMEQEMQFVEPNRSYERAIGTLNNLVIYIRFADQDEFASDTLLNYNRFNNDNANANSVLNYFDEISYGQLDLRSFFYPVPPDEYILSYEDEYPRSYYMPYNAVTNPDGYVNDNQRTNREHTLLVNAVEWVNINSPVPTELDLDYNNDNRVDNVVFIIRGGTTAWSTLLWPHRWSLYSQDVYINGKKVHDYNFQLETSLASSGVGVLCHELYHSLSAPDLYRYVDNSITPVGSWDIMAANNNPPQYMNAFMKMKYGGWIEDIPWITEAGTYTLNPLQSDDNNAWRIPSQNSSSEYFVLEYRKKDGTFDGTLPKSGMLIYRINSNAGNGNAQGPPDEVYIFRPGGTPSNDGNLNDAVFGANYGRDEFTDFSNPYAFLQNGNLGGVTIYDISEVGETMSFKVDFPGQVAANFTSDVKVACANDVIGFYDASTGIPDSWEWQFEPESFEFVEGDENDKNPKLRFLEEGQYSVSLVVSNEYGEDEVISESYLTIGAESGHFQDNFESWTFTDGSWMVDNPDNSETWELYSVGGNGSEVAAGINFRDYFSIMQRDRLISKPFDLSNLSTAYMSFDHAYAQNASYTQVTDSLIILISADCGETWERIAAFGEDGSGIFATHQPTDEIFWPVEATDWCGQGWGAPCNTIDLSDWAGISDVRIAFETVSFYGNPLLIDNVVVSQYVSTDENLVDNQVFVSPNPVKNWINIQFDSSENTEAMLSLFDLNGRMIYQNTLLDNTSIARKAEWKSGVYFIELQTTQMTIRQKLIFW
jgi:M6 family metalloprotease-like protein